MLRMNVKTDIDKVVRKLDESTKKQIPFATAVAITRTARAVERSLRDELAKEFDQPSRYVTQGTFATSAKKTDLSATVGMRDKAARGASPSQYVQEHFTSGARGPKPYEVALQRMGVLPQGMRAVPARGMKLDASGSPNRRALTELLGALERNMRVYSGRGRRMQQVGYFAVTPNKTPRTEQLQPGIYRRLGAGRGSVIAPVFYFVEEARYRKVIDLPEIAQRTIRTVFEGEFSKALDQAMRTAR